MGFLEPVQSLNPFRGTSDSSFILYGLLYDDLFSLDQDGNYVPNLALSASCDATCTNWTYSIRQGVLWSDGTAFTANDVAFTINYNIQNFAQLFGYELYLNRVRPCAKGQTAGCGAVVTSPWNVTVYFDRPFAPGKALFVPILEQAQWQAISAASAQSSFTNPTPIGTGPFIADPNIYTEWVNGQALHLIRNPNYHPVGAHVGPAILSDLYLQQFTDENALVAALEAGTVGLAKFTPFGYGAVQGFPNIGSQQALLSTQEWNMIGFSQLDTSTADSALNPARWDLGVRRALAMATNKDFIVNTIYQGKGVRGSTLISPITPQWWYDPVAAGTNLSFSIQQANALLNDSGFTGWTGGSFGNGIRFNPNPLTIFVSTNAFPNGTTKTIPAGTQLTFTMAVRQEFILEQDTANYLKAQWAQVGVNVVPKIEVESALANDVFSGKVETYIWFWSGGPDPNYLLSIQSGFTLDGWNDNYWDNASYNAQYVSQLETVNVTQRQAFVRNAEAVHYRSAVYLIYIYSYGQWAYRTDQFTNWGDWSAHPYRQMDGFWGANPLFLELTPAGVTNVPPSTPTITGPSSLTVGQLGTFVGSSTDPDPNETLAWTWSWGDGSTTFALTTSATTSMTAAHAWSRPGFFSVTLSVADPVTNVTSAPFSVEVFGASISNGFGRPGHALNLTVTLLEPSKGKWNVAFGDGSSTSGSFAAGSSTFALTHTYAAQGTYTATLTAKIGSSATTATSTVVVDGTPPVLTLPSSLVVEATGILTPVSFTVTATDNVGLAGPPTCNPASGSLLPLGTTRVACQATDLAGNTATGSFNVTVRDTTPPAILTPALLVAEASSPAGAIVFFGVNATDAVGVVFGPVCSPASGSQFPMGNTTVVCTAADAAGNVGHANFTVMVRDTTPPTIFTPYNVTAEATSSAGAVVTFDVSAFDAVGLASGPTCTPGSGSLFPIGLSLVVCTATDTSGNVAYAYIPVTVRDTTAPVTQITSMVDGSGFPLVDDSSTPSSSITFRFSGTDAVGVVGFVCDLDNLSLTPCVSGVTYSGLAPGLHSFLVSAVDAAGNFQLVSTRWFVITPLATVQDLINKVNALQAAGVITKKQADTLLAPLNKAYSDLSAGHVATTIKDLKSFNATVAQDITAGILTPATGQPLENEACDLIRTLGGTC